MYGVVLWSDKSDRKAVIWCEDHGDLAFYSGCEDSALDGMALDAGDLVYFDLGDSSAIRIAKDPRLVAEKQFTGLAERLRVGQLAAASHVSAECTRTNATGNVVAFQPRRGRQRLSA